MALGQAKRSLMMALFRKVILLIPLVFILPEVLGESNLAIAVSQPVVQYCNDSARVFCVLLAEPISDILAAAVTSSLFLQFYRTKLKDTVSPIEQH
jgi:Na+-driven multidrug efflux pump